MGARTSKQYDIPKVEAKTLSNSPKEKGVFLACHQKLKRRGKHHVKKSDKKSNDVINNEVENNEEKPNGVRKRVTNEYCAIESKKITDMGLLQSKSKVYEDTRESSATTDKKPTFTGDERKKNFVVSTCEKDKDGAVTLNAKQECDIPNNANEPKEVPNEKHEITNVVLCTSNKTNVHSKETNLKHDEIITEDDIIEEKRLSESFVRSHQHNEDTVPGKATVEENMPNQICEEVCEGSLELQPKAEVFTEKVEYITVEEKIVCEEYDDGTKIIRTIVSEIPMEKVITHKLLQKNDDDNMKINQEITDQEITNKANESPDSIVEQQVHKAKLSDFKLFIFNKYSEKLIKNVLKTSYNDSILYKKQKLSHAILTSGFINDIVNDIISESVINDKENGGIPNKACSVNNPLVSKNLETTQSYIDKFAEELVDSVIKPGDLKKLKTSDKEQINNKKDICNVNVKNSEHREFKGIDVTKVDCEEREEKEENPLQNGFHCNVEDADVAEEKNVKENESLMTVSVNNAINKELNLTIVDGHMKVNTDANQNLIPNVVLRKGKPGTDRPLSGFAEQLAELLADEDNLDFFDSDEELNESLDKIKTNFGPKRRISIEVNKLQHQFSVNEINEYSGKVLKSKASVKRRDRGNKFRTKGDRPMSLYAQDMLADILNDEEDEYISSDDSVTDESEDNDNEEDDVYDDKILPVKETAVLLENAIPLAPLKRNFSITSEYEIAIDEVMRSHFNDLASTPTSSGKGPQLRRAAVIDAGCGVLKAGLCGDTRPTCYCPSVIGVPRRFSQDASKMKKAYYVGDEAWSMAGMLQIDHPIKQSISNWPDVTSMMEYLLEEELKVNDNEHPIMLTEMGLTSNKNREKLTEIMFETFGIPAFYLSNQAALAMYSMGLVSGLCLSSGFYNTQAVPIYEGHSLPYATVQLDIGGDHVTDYLGRVILGNQGKNFNTSSEKLVLNSMKQSLCYIATDVKEEQEKYKSDMELHQLYTLPDGQEIELGHERCLASEILFDPNLIGLNQPNTAECIKQSIDIVNPDLYALMSQNVMVTGGNTKLSGYGMRLENELSFLCRDKNEQMTVNYADDPILATWVGGSILSSISVFRDQWITIDQYAETGAKIVHRYCF